MQPSLLLLSLASAMQVAPLLSLPRKLRLEHFALRGQGDAYRSLLQQVMTHAAAVGGCMLHCRCSCMCPTPLAAAAAVLCSVRA